ncbi:7358_t:CDS:2, partial [Ambispora leptoticha]
KDNNIKTLDLRNISIQQFEIIIRYIYGGVVQLENYNASFIFELMIIAYELLFEELAKYLETYLIEVEAQNDIIDNVQPYQQILEKNLWNGIIKRYLSPNRSVLSEIPPLHIALTSTLPNRITEPFSTVINEAHVAEISSWVDKRTNPYS